MPQSRTACPSGNALAPYFCVVLESNSKQSGRDRKSTRLNSSHGYISYAVFCLKKKHREIRTSRKSRTPERRLPARPHVPQPVEVAMLQEEDRIPRRYDRLHEDVCGLASHGALH